MHSRHIKLMDAVIEQYYDNKRFSIIDEEYGLCICVTAYLNRVAVSLLISVGDVPIRFRTSPVETVNPITDQSNL